MSTASAPSSSSRSTSPLFLIGQDSRGNWVVQDEQHTSGGLFVDRAAALRFALFENGRNPNAVIRVPGIFELNIGGKQHRAPGSPPRQP